MTKRLVLLFAVAAGVLLALRQGISLESLRRPLPKVRQVHSEKVVYGSQSAAE